MSPRSIERRLGIPGAGHTFYQAQSGLNFNPNLLEIGQSAVI
jgi:hypothetical protein